jgi:hypothetical protein
MFFTNEPATWNLFEGKQTKEQICSSGRIAYGIVSVMIWLSHCFLCKKKTKTRREMNMCACWARSSRESTSPVNPNPLLPPPILSLASHFLSCLYLQSLATPPSALLITSPAYPLPPPYFPQPQHRFTSSHLPQFLPHSLPCQIMVHEREVASPCSRGVEACLFAGAWCSRTGMAIRLTSHWRGWVPATRTHRCRRCEPGIFLDNR